MATERLIRPVVDALSRVLRPRGYRRRGLTFWRDSDGVRQFVNLQRSTSSTALAVRFTLNLAVLCPKALASWEPEFSVWSAPWCARIGAFISSEDKWWQATSEEEASVAAAEILHTLSNSAMQVLEEIDSVPALIEALRRGGMPVAVSEARLEGYIAKLEVCK
jgi:Domain of unknown function (DUF4304)